MAEMTEREDILRSFAAEEDQSASMLDRYLKKFPQFAVDLAELSLDIELAHHDAEKPLDYPTAGEADIDDVRHALSGTNGKGLAKGLGFPRRIIGTLRDREFRPETVPQSFLRGIATAASLGKGQLIAYLCLPEDMSPSLSMKADGKPEVQDKVAFGDFLDGLDLDEQQKARLLQGDFNHGSN